MSTQSPEKIIKRSSSNFLARFKGKISLINKDGYIGMAQGKSVPIEKRTISPIDQANSDYFQYLPPDKKSARGKGAVAKRHMKQDKNVLCFFPIEKDINRADLSTNIAHDVATIEKSPPSIMNLYRFSSKERSPLKYNFPAINRSYITPLPEKELVRNRSFILAKEGRRYRDAESPETASTTETGIAPSLPLRRAKYSEKAFHNKSIQDSIQKSYFPTAGISYFKLPGSISSRLQPNGLQANNGESQEIFKTMDASINREQPRKTVKYKNLITISKDHHENVSLIEKLRLRTRIGKDKDKSQISFPFILPKKNKA